jgi:hypothetical protein
MSLHHNKIVIILAENLNSKLIIFNFYINLHVIKVERINRRDNLFMCAGGQNFIASLRGEVEIQNGFLILSNMNRTKLDAIINCSITLGKNVESADIIIPKSIYKVSNNIY